jgi:protein TonB
VYRLGAEVSAPRQLFAPEPAYTEQARRDKRQGVVLLSAVVSDDGRVQNLRVEQGLGEGLDERALETVGTWRFKPAKNNGRPIAVQVQIKVHFRLY